MKLPLISQLVAISIFALTGMTPWFRAEASPFDEQEVNQDEYIAIARPYGDNKYDLLIIRQIPGQRQCWGEIESNSVTTIDPLLLNFNFAGSCQRSTDSNGYSMRIDGQDLGLDYLLRLVRRDKELILVGTHRSDPKQRDIVVGRTEGVTEGFLKINLDPGWRFTQRAYNGKVLGHVYLTGDSTAILAQPAENISDSSTESSVQEQTFTLDSQPSPISPSNNLTSRPSNNTLPPPLPSFSELPPLPPPTPKNVTGMVPPPPPNAVNSVQSKGRSLSSSTGTSQNYRVMVAVNSSQEKTRVRSLFPEAFSTSYQGRSMLQVGLFSDKNNAQKAEQSLRSIGLKPIILQ
ncbi:DUF3747 domain-containing protein [Crocosphaera sp. Alani8]|uniref:DUF3747 domain-containing protein n=1 Tax=Crocosphaera sp. Alani8 TaxID=3038952 RepID=UPI00313AF758